MAGRTKIDESVTVGPQPDEREIAALADEGFKAVVNFRTAGEDDQPLSPQAERQHAESAGLQYVHTPVSLDAMSADLVDGFRRQFESLPTPVFAHCKSGKRAGAMVMMHLAVEQGLTGQQTLEKAEEMGFECDQAQLREFVSNYVDNHSK